MLKTRYKEYMLYREFGSGWLIQGSEKAMKILSPEITNSVHGWRSLNSLMNVLIICLKGDPSRKVRVVK